MLREIMFHFVNPPRRIKTIKCVHVTLWKEMPQIVILKVWVRIIWKEHVSGLNFVWDSSLVGVEFRIWHILVYLSTSLFHHSTIPIITIFLISPLKHPKVAPCQYYVKFVISNEFMNWMTCFYELLHHNSVPVPNLIV